MSDSLQSMYCSPPDPSDYGIPQGKILEWLPFPSLEDLSNPEMKPISPTMAGRLYNHWAIRLSVQPLSHVRFFATLWTTALQASLSITNSWSLPKLMSLESMMPSNHLILSSPSPPALNLTQYQGLSKWVSSSNLVGKVLEFQLQHQSFQ